MRDDYLSLYETNARFLFVAPSVACTELHVPTGRERSCFTIGLLSNLCVEKGLDDVIETFSRLAGNRPSVRLILAGPCRRAEDRRRIEEAIARWPNSVEYRGPVYNGAKAQFFADIDAFVFPTRTESWGIVLDESLMAGCPVIARAKGCIPWIVRGGCGLVVDPALDFPETSAGQIQRWIDSPSEYLAARTAAAQRSRELTLEADSSLRRFVDDFVTLGDAGENRG